MDRQAQAAKRGLILEDSRLLRLATVALFYFAQGVPQGFFYIAIPTWMAVGDASAAQIAAVVSASALPWTLKFVNGALMDRYTFLAMGRRRAWIIASELLLTLAFLAGVVLSPAVTDVAILSALGMAAGFGSAFQDVSIDSLAIDIMDEDERTKAAGLMFGSAMLGISYSTWLGGQLLANSTVAVAFLAIAVVPALVLLFGLAIRERRGERLLPWTQGAAHPRNIAIQIDAWWPLLRRTFAAILTPASIVFAFVIFARMVPQGVADTLHPILATREAGWALERYTNLQSLIQLIAGLLGLFVFGWLCARIGAQRGIALAAGLTGAMYAAMAASSDLWTDPAVLTAFFYGFEIIGMLLIIAIIPVAMRICSPAVAATQFTIYMALSNFGRPTGAWLVATLGEGAGVTIFAILAALFAAVTVIALLYRFPQASAAEAKPDLAPEAQFAA